MSDILSSFSYLQNKFGNNFKIKIAPLLGQIEQKRRIKLLQSVIVVFVCICLSFFCLYSTMKTILTFQTSNSFLFSIISGLSIGFGFIFCFYANKNFNKDIKKIIMPAVYDCFDNLKWSQDSCKNDKLFSSSLLFQGAVRKTYYETFNWANNNSNIEITNAMFNGGRYTVFKGTILKIDTGKKFKSHTLIRKSNFFSFGDNLIFSDFHKFKSNNAEFNKKFSVCTTDEHEAKSLLTDSFIKQINKLEKDFMPKDIRCAFFENSLIIALDTKQSLFFNHSLFAPADNPKEYYQLFENIVSLLSIAEGFNNNL